MGDTIKELKSLNHGVCSLTNLILALGGIVPYIVLLRPTFLEAIATYIVDFAMLAVLIIVDKKLYAKLRPYSQKILVDIKPEEIKALDRETKSKVLNEFFIFPNMRSIYMIFMSAIKVTPTILMITFFWELDGRTVFWQFMIALGVVVQNMFLYCSCTLIEAHKYLSEKNELLSSYDPEWLELNAKRKSSNIKVKTAQITITSLVLTATLLVVQICTLVASDSFSQVWLLASIITVSFFAFLFMGYMLSLFVNYSLGGLKNIFAQFNNLLVSQRGGNYVALSTSELLNPLEAQYNSTVDKLKNKDQEIDALIYKVSEKSSFESIGQISSLLVHDLMSPLHVLKALLTSMTEHREKVTDKHIRHLSLSIDKISELCMALRAKLKNAPEYKVCNTYEAVQTAAYFLQIEFQDKGITEDCFEVDDRLTVVNLEFARVDLIQILSNLMRNSVENLVLSKNSSPKVKIELSDSYSDGDQYAILKLSDNGTGLAQQTFKDLTENPSRLKGRSLGGLYLCFNRVRANGGVLELLNSKDGTEFKLTLKTSTIKSTKDPKVAFKESATINPIFQ